MATPIRSYDVVAVGDTVELRRPGYPPEACKVISGRTPNGMTVQLRSGLKVRHPYVEANGHVNFYSLNARECWLAAPPAEFDGAVCADLGRGFVSMVLTADDVRDLAATTVRLKKLAAWLAAEPKLSNMQVCKVKPRTPRRKQAR